MYPNLKLQMWKVGIRQNRLAKMLEMDETVLSKIVNGFREPNEESPVIVEYLDIQLARHASSSTCPETHRQLPSYVTLRWGPPSGQQLCLR